jgi:hypothetical protein
VYCNGQAADYAGGDAVGVAAGNYHTCVLTSNGNVDCYGNNDSGQAADYTGGDAVSCEFCSNVPLTFNDVPSGYWAESHIQEIACAGITSGCGGGDFCPEDNVTRAQMAVFVPRALGEAPAATCTGIVFNDVNAASVGDGFCRYIEKFSELGITSGCGGGDFCPEDYVTRAQMAVFLPRALGEAPAATCTGIVFNDVNGGSVGDGFCRYIEKFSELGITSGCGGGDFCPYDTVTRAQMAVFLTRGFLTP